MSEDRQASAIKRLHELHQQGVPFFKAREILLGEGFTKNEIINGAFQFRQTDHTEESVAANKKLKDYLTAHPEAADKIARSFATLVKNKEENSAKIYSIVDFAKGVEASVQNNHWLG